MTIRKDSERNYYCEWTSWTDYYVYTTVYQERKKMIISHENLTQLRKSSFLKCFITSNYEIIPAYIVCLSAENWPLTHAIISKIAEAYPYTELFLLPIKYHTNITMGWT